MQLKKPVILRRREMKRAKELQKKKDKKNPQCGEEVKSSNKQNNGRGESQACQSTPRIGGGLCQPRKQLEKANSTENRN
ncbi:hypothetical protein CAEBREN_20029 [Caenorhabditis brenneri]|uniref:Uncharacterized protein n=1 Tax=Caenorhabditis brenneri TaxID=135651 RepID=G0N7U1_CAEBE|nr:hypothetical protein CAEBREN_20029 [Caenorhabditis brenneri]